MSELREARQKLFNHMAQDHSINLTESELEDIIILASKALEQDKQEPVAWMFPCDIKRFMETETNGVAYSVSMGHPDKGSTEPLYTHPAPMRELSDDEIAVIAIEVGVVSAIVKDGLMMHYARIFARACIKAARESK